MKRFGLIVTLVVAAASAHASGGWQEVTPPGGVCADGSAWRFYFRPGTSNHVAIYFQGGGACWTSQLCDPRAELPYDANVGAEDHPAKSAGLFDFQHAGNPIADWNVLYLPNCTADVHTGNRVAEYSRADGTVFTIHHRGRDNTRAALAWLESRLIAQGVAPQTVLLSGESAGAVAAAYWAIEVGDRFPDAALAVVGDAAGGYRTLAVNAALAQWNALAQLPDAPAYADPSAIYFESFYLATAQHRPDARLAQMNFSDDAVQRRFRQYLGSPVEELTKDLTCNLNEIRRDAPGFHSYIYPGTAHEMLRTDALYTTVCEGHRLVAWVDDILKNRPVTNRWCEGSSAPFSNVDVPRL